MHKSLRILAFAGLIGMFSCNDDDNTPAEGNDQIAPPVQNSGPETEMERATAAIKQDTTGKEVIIGDDDD